MLTSHTPRGIVLAVFDGHGLVPTGHLVSDLCVKRFMPILELQPAWRAPVAPRKDDGVIKALRKVVEVLEKEADLLTDQVRVFSGSTICALVLRGGWMYSVNVGDSRAVLAVTEAKRLQPVQLTTDHSVSNPIERERIERNGGWVANNRLNGDLEMSRTIGDMEFKKYRNQRRFNHTGRAYGPELLIATPDIEARRMRTSDVMVVVATDGLWLPGISNDAVITAAAGWVKAVGTEETAKRLVGMALEWGSRDNITVVVGVFGELPEYVKRNRFREFRERRRLRKNAADKERTVHGDHSFEQVSDHDGNE